MLKKYLMSAMNDNIPVSLYADKEDTENCMVGFIQGVTEEHVLVACFGTYGLYDGFTIKKCKDIFRLDSKDTYTEKVFKLYKFHEQKHPLIVRNSDNLVFDLLQHAKDNRLVVALVLCESDSDTCDAQGFISTIHDGMVTIEQVCRDGCNDGACVVRLEDISTVYCDSDEQMAVKILAENR